MQWEKKSTPCDGHCGESTHPRGQGHPVGVGTRHCRLTVGGTSRPLRNRRKGRAGGWVCLSALQKDCLRMTAGRWSSETPCVTLDLLPPAQHEASHFAKEKNEPQVKWLATQVTRWMPDAGGGPCLPAAAEFSSEQQL